jgi:hypothetical protein
MKVTTAVLTQSILVGSEQCGLQAHMKQKLLHIPNKTNINKNGMHI